MNRLKAGMKFDTNYETGCTFITLPDKHGNFVGLDSDGVECEFHADMVVRTY